MFCASALASGPRGARSGLDAALYYLDANRFVLVPAWARYFINIGRWLPEQCPRLTIGIAVPTRAFVTALVATGSIIAATSGGGRTRTVAEEHIERLRSLPAGTALVWYRGGKRYRGEFVQWIIDGDRHFLEVMTARRGAEKRQIPVDQLDNVEVAARGKRPVPANTTGWKVKANRAFLAPLLGDANVDRHIQQSALDCVIVGHRSVLAAEIEDTMFASLAEPEGYAQGTLQDVLRVREFSGKLSAYRSIVAPTDSDTAQQGLDAPIVIFDGANPFVKWHDRWRQSRRIVVLDRTERAYLEAATILNEEYYTRRRANLDLPFDSGVSGVEVFAFESATI